MNPLKSFLSGFRVAMNFNLFGNASMVAHFLASSVEKVDTTPKAVINISSFMGHSNSTPYQAAYSKAAFAHMLQHLADEVTADKCQIVNVHPGAILTDSSKNAPQELLDAVSWDEGKLHTFYHGRI